MCAIERFLAPRNVSSELLVQQLHRAELGLVNVGQLLVERMTVHHRDGSRAVQLLLKVHQLLHERHVRADLGPFVLDVVVRVLQAHAMILHQVSQTERGRSTDSGDTMYQHHSTSFGLL